MTSPKNSTTSRSGARLYQHPVTGVEVPSVTTILSVLDKPALPRWAALEVATYAVEHRDSWQGLPARDAVELLKKAPWGKTKNAADAGTDAHAHCEALLKGTATPLPKQDLFSPLYGKALENVEALIAAVKPQPIAIEATAWSNGHGYAGTFDGLHIIDGQVTLVDLKTSKAVYPDYALQLAAYRFADSVLLPDGSEVAMPEITRCQIWHAPKEGTWSVVDIRADHDEFATFIAALNVWKWKHHHAPDVILTKTPAKRTTKKTTTKEGKVA